MKIVYLEWDDVKKIPSRHMVTMVAEFPIENTRSLRELDEQSGVFIPLELKGVRFGPLELDVDPREIEALLRVAFTPGAPGAAPEPATESKGKSLAQRMAINGYFLNRDLWAAMEALGYYTQAEHCDYLRSLPPVTLYPDVPSTGDIILHHVRTAANSGTGIKPEDWYQIPIHDSQHQHLHGHATREDREQHLAAAVELTEAQMRVKFKEALARESMSGLTVEELIDFEDVLGIKSTFTAAARPNDAG